YNYIISLQFSDYNYMPATDNYTLSLHDALPISCEDCLRRDRFRPAGPDRCRDRSRRYRPHLHLRLQQAHTSPALLSDRGDRPRRSEEHTSELQSRENLVCRLLLEKKNI